MKKQIFFFVIAVLFGSYTVADPEVHEKKDEQSPAVVKSTQQKSAKQFLGELAYTSLGVSCAICAGLIPRLVCRFVDRCRLLTLIAAWLLLQSSLINIAVTCFGKGLYFNNVE